MLNLVMVKCTMFSHHLLLTYNVCKTKSQNVAETVIFSVCC